MDCSTKLQVADVGDTVELVTDIVADRGSACIDFGTSRDIVFDGGGHTISRGTTGYHGIYSGSTAGTGNTIRNVEVRGFSRGILIANGNTNTITNCTLIGNMTGIELYSASANTIENSVVKENFTGIHLLYNSDYNVIKSSDISRNHGAGIALFPRLSVGSPENNQVYDNILSDTMASNLKEQTSRSIFKDHNRPCVTKSATSRQYNYLRARNVIDLCEATSWAHRARMGRYHQPAGLRWKL